ncbi:MAG: hypothetical protein POELPBGB_03496 [Bacteroidia bacterium]|nr:hypothetical protein [Bacteroidia bacterium]
MDISEIVSITGQSGLFKVISQTKNGFIAESLTDKRRIPVYATQKVIALENISIFTTGDDQPLEDVLKKAFELYKGAKSLDAAKASNDELKKEMEKVLPEYDKERVYVSDIKKFFQWYNMLHDAGQLTKEKKADEKHIDVAHAHDKATQKPVATVTKQHIPKPAAPKVSTTTGVRKSGTA